MRSRTTAVVGAIALVLACGASAAQADVGVPGPSYAGGGSPTGSKPQSKVWYAGDRWWASMVDAAGAHRIHELQAGAWTSTGVALDTRSRTRDDVLWDEARGKLYVASHVFTNEDTGGSEAPSGLTGRLYRLSLDEAAGTWTMDPGFPVELNAARSETLVLARDGDGALWATWVQERRVHVSHTLGSDSRWSAPLAIPGTATVTDDDISSIVAFGDAVGVMWTDQAAGATRFAVHRDGDPADAWSVETVPTGWTPDDHVSLKADGGGRVYAATKTSSVASGDPMTLLLVREPDGTWSSRVVSRVADGHTRPIVVLDEARDRLHVFATRGQAGGPIVRKSTSLSAPSFAAGPGAVVMDDAASGDLNDVTSAKGPVGAGGIVLLANANSTDRYWHAEVDPMAALHGGPAPVVARFSAAPTRGEGPLRVEFEDESAGAARSWAWSFGDGATSDERNPTHRYAAPGTYTVTLRVTDAGGSSDEERRTGLVVVRAPAAPPPAPPWPPAEPPADPRGAEPVPVPPAPAPRPGVVSPGPKVVTTRVALRARRIAGARVRFAVSVTGAPRGARATLQLRSPGGRWVRVRVRFVRSGAGYAAVLRRRPAASTWRVTVGAAASRPLRLAGARLRPST